MIGPRERRDLIKRMELIAKEANETGAEILVAFDRSGRPVGSMLKKILKEAYGRDVQLYFLDPTIAKRGQLSNEELSKLLEKEHPHLIKAIPGKQLMLVDDQVWSGSSFSAIKELFHKYSPKKISFGYLSAFPDQPTPSWREHNILGIETQEGKFVVRRNKETIEQMRRIRRFRKKLTGIARKVSVKLRK